jgi:hypothetical protein
MDVRSLSWPAASLIILLQAGSVVMAQETKAASGGLGWEEVNRRFGQALERNIALPVVTSSKRTSVVSLRHVRALPWLRRLSARS